MHINGKIITKQFISCWNSKWLSGSVGRAHIYTAYIFWKSNEEIVVQTQNQRSFFFIIYSLCSCLCVILQLILILHLSKSLGFIPTRRGDHPLRPSFGAQ